MKAKSKKGSFKWELVWKTTSHVRGVAGAIKHKFSPKWEGPYIVEEAHATRHYWLKDQASIIRIAPLAKLTLRNIMLSLVKIPFFVANMSKMILCFSKLIL